MAAVVLGSRRLGGGLSRPLELPALAVVATTIAALAAAARAAWRQSRSVPIPARRDWALWAAISVAVLVLGIAVSLPGTSPAGLVAFWAILAVEESLAWLRGSRRRPREDGRRVQGSGSRVQGSGFMVQDSQRPSALDQPPEADVLQQLTRSRGPSGMETLSGWLRVPLAAGQRSTSVHVAFCPPFARTPKATLQQIDGPTARIKTVQLLPYGVRFDVKLAVVSESAELLLFEFSAHCAPPQ